jgi:branched-chain amino acid transport system substrate-binding protein
MRKFLALVLTVFLVSGAAPQEETVSIGLAAPLTGAEAYIGEGLLQGARIAVEEANIKGPVFGNTKIKLVPMDDQRNPTQAVLSANKLIADPSVVAVVGHFNSSCTKASSSLYHEGRMAQITPASTNPDISRQGFDTFFRVCATDDVQAPAGANFVWSKLGIKKIAIIDDQTTYGKGLADQFEKTYKALGGEVLRREGITQGDKDFTPLLTKIRASKPEMVFYGGVYPELALLIKQSAKVGLKAPWMGGDGIADVSLIKLVTPKLAEGTYATMLGVDPKSLPAAKDFVAKYEARFGDLGTFSVNGYDSTNILIEAIRRAGKADRAAVLAEVRATQDFPGLMGTINFDEKGDAIGRSIGIFKVQDGKFVFIEEVKPE